MRSELIVAPRQPETVDIKMADGVFVKSIRVPDAFTLIPQHSHLYDHTSMLAVGSVRVWADEKLLGDFIAPHGILIKAKVKHRFLTLVPGTLIYCIHNLSHTGEIEVDDEHYLDFGG